METPLSHIFVSKMSSAYQLIQPAHFHARSPLPNKTQTLLIWMDRFFPFKAIPQIFRWIFHKKGWEKLEGGGCCSLVRLFLFGFLFSPSFSSFSFVPNYYIIHCVTPAFALGEKYFPFFKTFFTYRRKKSILQKQRKTKAKIKREKEKKELLQKKRTISPKTFLKHQHKQNSLPWDVKFLC